MIETNETNKGTEMTFTKDIEYNFKFLSNKFKLGNQTVQIEYTNYRYFSNYDKPVHYTGGKANFRLECIRLVGNFRYNLLHEFDECNFMTKKEMMEYLKAHWRCIAGGFVAGLIVSAMLLS